MGSVVLFQGRIFVMLVPEGGESTGWREVAFFSAVRRAVVTFL